MKTLAAILLVVSLAGVAHAQVNCGLSGNIIKPAGIGGPYTLVNTFQKDEVDDLAAKTRMVGTLYWSTLNQCPPVGVVYGKTGGGVLTMAKPIKGQTQLCSLTVNVTCDKYWLTDVRPYVGEAHMTGCEADYTVLGLPELCPEGLQGNEVSFFDAFCVTRNGVCDSNKEMEWKWIGTDLGGLNVGGSFTSQQNGVNP